MRRRFSSAALLTVATCLLPLGCNDHPLKPVELDRVEVGSTTVGINPQRAVDILFVIDNSGSMAEEQATLAANFEAFIEVLEDPAVAADYRIAVTTTDSGSRGCTATGPEDGKFVSSSCLSRIDEFQTHPNALVQVDAREEACESLCPAEFADLETTPTSVRGDGEPSQRPWIENIAGNINLPEDVDTAQAFACMGPQGLRGCGFESPLRAMSRAVTRMSVESEREFGFLRDEAILLVVFVTDEADCSENPDSAVDIFETSEGTSVRPDACWSAGVACESLPDGTLDCVSANVDRDRNATSGEALLSPVEEAIALLQQVEDNKRTNTGNENLDVMVSLIAGVPTGYPTAEITYSKSTAFADEFGIDAGCSSDNGTAVPPVRLLEFAEAFQIEDRPNASSVCASDYTPALEELANRLIAEFKPACNEDCLADVDALTEGHQNDCVFSQSLPGGEKISVSKCEETPNGWALPDGEDACVYVATGEERDLACVEDGSAVEFRPLYRAGVARVPGAAIQATCSVADEEALDCPWLFE